MVIVVAYLTGSIAIFHTEYMSGVGIFMTGFFVGGAVEFLLTLIFDFLEKKPLKVNHRFSLGKRISLFTLPIWGLLAIIFTRGAASYVIVFIYSAVIGTALEGLLGKFIKKFFGVKMWSYRYGTIGPFFSTSIYSLPYWGAAGLVFGTLGKMLGI